MNSMLIKKILLILFTLFTLLSIYIGFTSGAFKDGRSQDYQWGPSKILMEHHNPYQQYAEFKEGKIENPFMMSQAPNYPASAYIFLWPYAAMDWNMAKLAWAVSNLIFTILILIGLQRLFPIKKKKILFFIVLLFLGGASWRTVLGNGQHALFVMASFIWALIYSKDKPILSGILLAISWFKYTITFPLTLFFIYKKSYKAIVVSTLVHILLTLFVAYWINQPIMDFFFGPIQTAMTATNIGEIDIFGIVKRFDIPISLAYLSIAIILYFVVNIFTKKGNNKSSDLMLLSFLSLLSLIIFFHLGYDFVLLILPLWFVFYTDRISSNIKYLVLSSVILQWYIASIFNIASKKLSIDTSIANNIFIILQIILIYYIFIYLYKQLSEKTSI